MIITEWSNEWLRKKINHNTNGCSLEAKHTHTGCYKNP